jgi:SpoVK/Ycf46/Vps4 family AAA+-type ATPase
MFEINMKSLKIDEKLQWDKIVKLTKDYSGADIAIVCREAAYMPMRKKLAKIGGISKIT